MASNADIFEARLRLHDPAGPIRFVAVDSQADIPETPAFQTGYLAEDTGYYYLWDDVANASELMISDARLGALIDSFGVDKAVCRAVSDLMFSIGREMTIQRESTGAESTEFVSLRDHMAYLRDLRKQCDEDASADASADTGQWSASARPEIAGGDL